MRISQAFPSKYLKATDIPKGREVTVQIDAVLMEVMEQSNEEKPILSFIGKQKGLVLNVTNSTTLSEAYGDDTDEWHGKPVVLFASTTSFNGRNVACLRLRAPDATSAPVVAPAQENVTTNVAAGDDDIPF